MVATEALTGLVSLVGAGGVTSIVLGYLAFKTQALKGRREPLDPDSLRTANGNFPGSADIEILANATSFLASTLVRSNMIAEYRIDRRGEHDRFAEWLRKRELEATLEAFQAEQRERHRRTSPP